MRSLVTCWGVAAAATLVGATKLSGATPVAVARPVGDAPSYLTAAFAADGFDVVEAYSFNVTSTARWGLKALSRNATIGTSNALKPAYYVEGSGYEMGYLRGYISENETNVMTSTYLDHIVPSMVDEDVDNWLQNSSYAPAYDVLIGALADLLTADAVEAFAVSQEAGAIPSDLIDEMRGMADGARARNFLTTVTYERIVTLNFGYDYLLALIYSGNIFSLLGAKAAARGAAQEQVEAIAALPPWAIRPPLLCDAFAARGNATKSGHGSIFARDFQFALALVFQDLQAPTIHVPSDGRHPLVNVGGPGFVGAMTAMNDAGVAMGVDVLQSSFANSTVVGLNSLLMVRATMHAVNSTAAAVDFVAAQQRGPSWLYPMSDASGDGRIIEAGPTVANNSLLPDYRVFVEDAALAAALPDPAYLAATIEPFLDYRRGIFVRNMSTRMPLLSTVIPGYNPALFALAGETFPNATEWLPGGSLFPSPAAESAAYKVMKFHYFSPEHIAAGNTDIIAVSNLALVPHMRISGMGFWTSIDGMGAPQWRYDTLVNLVIAAAGTIDLAAAQEIITFLSPSRTPGYNGPEVPGVITVCDLQERVATVKGGYWTDEFITITLPRYLHPQ